MKKNYALIVLLILTCQSAFAQTHAEFTTQIMFPGGYSIGDYMEFVRVSPIGAGESGYYEVSISYTRNNVAAAATYLASVSHANPSLWREVGRVNSNGYASGGSTGHNFTIDLNTDYYNPRFRIRAVATLGEHTAGITGTYKSTLN